MGIAATRLVNPGLRLTNRRVGVAIVYHAIGLREGDPRYELVPPRERAVFRRQLRYLRRHFALVPAAGFPAAVAARRRGGRFPVCLTFDDDLPEHVEHALPVLREEGVAATFFLCGASLDGAKSFWWERVQRAVDAGTTVAQLADLLPEPMKSRVQHADLDINVFADLVQGLTPSERDSVSRRLLAFAGPDPPAAGLRAESVTELANAGCAIGFHTRRHDDLRRLDDEQLERAMHEGREDLARLARRPVDLIAYPHGSADNRVAVAAAGAGFKLGFTGIRCAVTPTADPLLLGRVFADHAPSAGELALMVVGTLLKGPECGMPR
jgi:peptidoglycan/xylan/chitin deacetylase (PgdA/CDA1 family)